MGKYDGVSIPTDEYGANKSCQERRNTRTPDRRHRTKYVYDVADDG